MINKVKSLAQVQEYSSAHLAIVEGLQLNASYTSMRTLTRVSTSEARLKGMEKTVLFQKKQSVKCL